MISTGYPLCRRFVPMKHNVINYKLVQSWQWTVKSAPLAAQSSAD
jgi:hypothetical protein